MERIGNVINQYQKKKKKYQHYFVGGRFDYKHIGGYFVLIVYTIVVSFILYYRFYSL